MKKLSAFPLIILLLASCQADPDPAQFSAPKIIQTSSTVEKNVVILTCSISGMESIKSCGFLFGTEESDLDRNICSMTGDGLISLQLDGLTFNTDYYFRSFIDNGRDEQTSGSKHFRIQQRVPDIELKSITDRTAQRIVAEYTVSENFSGEMIVCGLCWGTEPEPTIEGTSKTVDSAMYGTHRTEISGLAVGQTYYMRAYAINAKGTAYSDEQQFYVPVTFSSEKLTEYMVETGDADGDGYLSVEEALLIREIDFCTDETDNLDGLEFCTGLTSIRCTGSGSHSGKLTEVNLAPFAGLEHLQISDNRLTSIDLSCNPELTSIILNGNYLSSFDLPTALTPSTVDVSDNKLSTLDVSEHGSLTCIRAAGNPLESILLPTGAQIEELSIGRTLLSNHNDLFKKVRGLKRLDIQGILCDTDKIYLMPGLEKLDCSGSEITTLDLRSNPALTSLSADNCTLLESMDLNLNPLIKTLSCLSGGLKTLHLLEGQEIEGVNKGDRTCIPYGTQIIYTPRITDEAFLNYLKDNFDSDYDAFVSLAEASAVSEISIDNTVYSGISSLYGIQMFTSLEKLNVSGQNLTSLDLKANGALSVLCCDNNPLKSLDLSGNAELKMLYAQSTSLETIDLSHNYRLEAAYLSRSALTSLDVSGCTALKILDCANTPALKQIILSRLQDITIIKNNTTEIVYVD